MKNNSRGAKRTCQNEDCGKPFYDLSQKEFSCPSCGEAFDLEAAERPAVVVRPAGGFGRSRQAPELKIVAPDSPEATASADDGDDDEGATSILDADDDDETVTTPDDETSENQQ
ncbi:MAG TPA: FYDLN acid domain-containing protein [Hyphomicrobiaceae bacterium]|nr:FYDLN acid domain-containing protein [Hyphomicrobiaceae bacterium]